MVQGEVGGLTSVLGHQRYAALGLEEIAHLGDVLDWGLVLHVDCWLFLWVFGFECTELVVGLESSLHGTSRTEHHTKSNL